MKKNSEDIKFLFIGFCTFIIAYLYHSFIPYKVSSNINDFSCWYTYAFSKNPAKKLKLIGVAIDEHSLNKIPQRWPWKRSIYAQAIKILDKEQAHTIGIDFTLIGESEEKKDDLILKDALDAVSSRVVLAYLFDYQKQTPVWPLPQFRDASYALGMVNTPQDADGMTRRLRSYIELEGKYYYSLSLAISASFLGRTPQDIIPSIPLLKDKTFLVNYLLRPKDIVTLSFYDLLENTEKIKRQYGNGFLKDALVVIYPAADIFHDMQSTPLGKMPGGLLHLNGAADIILQRFIREDNILLTPFLIFSLAAVFYILRRCGFISGILFTIGVLFIDFWFLVLLSLAGIRFDYSSVVISALAFFILGSAYKYAHFLTQLLKIKDKATLDPLRGLFNLRYFYYRLELELKKIYLGKELVLIFIYLESFKDAFEDLPLDTIRNIWKQIQPVISLRNSFWSVYSQEELAGCVLSSLSRVALTVHSLKNNLEAMLQEREIKSNIKIGYVRLKKDYPVRELLYILSEELKNGSDDIVLFKDGDLDNFLRSSYLKAKGSEALLDVLDADIEEKNRQLLSFIDNLNKEHAKSKEAFFEIITSLVKALEARDPYTEGHSQRVCNYSLKMAEELGWAKEEKEKLKKAALLHDLGKIGIPDSILHKKGALNDEEYEFIKKHEIIATMILEPLKEFSEILPWILYHHERWDGKGYPHGLAGNAIPVPSQIIALSDVFDALMTGRDYKVAFSCEETINALVKNKGTQFNPELTDIFVGIILRMQPEK